MQSAGDTLHRSPTACRLCGSSHHTANAMLRYRASPKWWHSPNYQNFSLHTAAHLPADGLWLRLSVSVGAAICVGFNIHADLWRVAVHTVCGAVTVDLSQTRDTHTRMRARTPVFMHYSAIELPHMRPYRTVIVTKGFMFCIYCYPHKLYYSVYTEKPV